MALTLRPDHPLLADVLDAAPFVTVEVCLGANPSAARHLTGSGVPCVLYPKLADGSIGGTGGHAGFVVEFDANDLVAAGATDDEIYFACDAREGEYVDVDDDRDPLPVCGECLLQGDPSARLEGQDPMDWEVEGRDEDADDEEAAPVYRGRLYNRWPADRPRKACWCCSVSIQESWQAAEESNARRDA